MRFDGRDGIALAGLVGFALLSAGAAMVSVAAACMAVGAGLMAWSVWRLS